MHGAFMGMYSITTWHGEGKTIRYLVDDTAPEGEQPAVVFSWDVRLETDK
jgi:hypothetical protein